MNDVSRITADRSAILGTLEDARNTHHTEAWASLEIAIQLARLNESLNRLKVSADGGLAVTTCGDDYLVTVRG